MAALFAELLKLATKWWHEPPAAWLLPVAVFLGVVAGVSGWGTSWPQPPGLALAAGLAVITSACWLATNRVPRNKLGSVGVAVALIADDDTQDKQVQADFLDSLKQRFQDDPEGARFYLLVLPTWLAVRAQDIPTASRILDRTRCHFLLYGKVHRREIQKQTSHVLRFEGMVRHRKVSEDLQRDLAADFQKVLPRKLSFPEDNSVFAFEATSEWTDVSARYIIACAAMLSGDPRYAEKLFLSVQRRLRSTSPRFAPLQQIVLRLPERLTTLYEGWHRALFDVYYLRRSPEVLEELRHVTEQLLALNPANYQARLSLAILDFSTSRDVTSAKRHLYECRRIRDATWRYSLAFLYAYEGNTVRALEEYKQAFVGRLKDVTVPVQCEEFIHMVLADEPHKGQLHFYSGLINLRAKEDGVGARRDFLAFLAHPSASTFPTLVSLANRYLSDLDSTSVAG